MSRLFAYLLFVAFCGVASAQQSVLIGKIEKIIEGDTIEVRLQSGLTRVRLHGIDAPEPGMAYFEEANAALFTLAQTREVELLVVEQDLYEGIVARAYVDGMDVAADLIHRGFAYTERQHLKQLPYALNYCVLEEMARKARSGLWQLSASDRPAPWEWRRKEELEGRFTDYGLQSAQECVAASS